MRARYPDLEGHLERQGVRIHYEVMGDGDIAVLLLPTWSIAHSQVWRFTAPYLSRHFKVITFDGRGNGRSDRPRGADAYAEKEFAADAIAVMDELRIDRAVTVGLSMGTRWNLILAAEHPQRVLASVHVAPALPLLPSCGGSAHLAEEIRLFEQEAARFDRNYIIDHYQDFVRQYAEGIMSEPHSTRGLEQVVEWGLGTDAETIANTLLGCELDPPRVRALCKRSRAPSLVIHGDDDKIQSCKHGEALAEALNAPLIIAEGCGHSVCVRHPVWFNRTLKQFIDRAVPSRPRTSTWRKPMHRKQRALYLSSPIGLGHARRDVTIAAELRKLKPDLEIDWLTQSPVDRILVPRGERLHPASRLLASEVGHIESQSDDHGQPIFPIFRNMDEILVANFMVFQEVMEAEKYDLVIADEGWEVDHFLHENPELKSAPFVWATDVIGFLPTAEGDEPFDPTAVHQRGRAYEELVAADYNAEMIERIDRFRRVRDLAIYIGNQDDIPDGSFGPGLPSIQDWTNEHFTYGGYVLGFDPGEVADREAVRAELGFQPHEKVCIVAVGGMSTGQQLLRRVIAAFPLARRRVPELRMIVVAGPRIDPASLSPERVDGLEIRGFVDDLYKHMAVCDLAIVHGGLTQAMDLTANNVPFIAVPFLRQFEQNVWVRHRLRNYGAGRYLDYRDLHKPGGFELLANAMVEELGKGARHYRPVERGAETRIASMIAELL